MPVPDCPECDVRGSVKRTHGTEQWAWYECSGCSALILVDRDGIRKVMRGAVVLFQRDPN